MKEYLCPRTVREAIDLVATHPGARFLAGGTDLVVGMRERLFKAETVIDISEVAELRRVAGRPEEGIVVGAAVRLVELMEDARVPPVLRAACARIGTPQVRNLATIGGNVCNASPAGDTITPLLVLDAVARVAGTGGTRDIPLSGLFTGPKKTALGPGEILVSLTIPAEACRGRAAFRKIGRRKEAVISQVNAAAAVAVSETGVITRARLALGSVAPTPIRVPEAEAALTGKKPSLDLIEEAAAAALGRISPISDVRTNAAYRQRMAFVLSRRVIYEAIFGKGDS